MGDPKRNGNDKLDPAPVEMPATVEEVGEPDATEGKPDFGWREIIRQAFVKARQSHEATSSQSELRKDKTKAMLVLGGSAVLMLLLFLGVFSSPQRAKKAEAGRRQGAPDLGRRTTPGQENSQAGSATPLLNAQVGGDQGLNKSDVTPEDIDRTARAGHAHNLSPAPAPAAEKQSGSVRAGQGRFRFRPGRDTGLRPRAGLPTSPNASPPHRIHRNRSPQALAGVCPCGGNYRSWREPGAPCRPGAKRVCDPLTYRHAPGGAPRIGREHSGEGARGRGG